MFINIFLGELMNKSVLQTAHHQHEFDAYMQTEIPDKADPLTFWKTHAEQLPATYDLVLKHLCVPATSTPSERVFSFCSLTLTDRRSRMTAGTLEKLIFLRYNLSP